MIEPTSPESTPQPTDAGAPEEGAVNESPKTTVRAPDAGPSESTPLPTRDIPAVGTVLQARVIETTDEKVVLDVGLSRRAAAPLSLFKDFGAVPATGAELCVVVEGYEPAERLLNVAPTTATPGRNGSPLTPGTRVEGIVSGMVRGGLEVQLSELRAFMPSSQVDSVRVKDISVFLGQTVVCEVLENDKSGLRPVVSRRKVVEKERSAQRKHVLSELEVGQKRKGTVVNLADYGAFVDLGGLRGLLHIGDMSWETVAKPTDIVKLGDEIEVAVLEIDKKRKRISLGMKQLTPDPWAGVAEKFQVGARISTRIARLSKFGAFAEVAEGITGLIPLSEFSWQKRSVKISEVTAVGSTTEVIVAAVDEKRRRLTLSIKRLTEDPWAKAGETFSTGSLVSGTVRSLLDFGVIVELEHGFEGMIHISELADRRVEKPGDIVSSGETVEVKVLGVDTEKHRISLSLKKAKEPPAKAPTDGIETTAPRVRKKPLRGGLSAHFKF